MLRFAIVCDLASSISRERRDEIDRVKGTTERLTREVFHLHISLNIDEVAYFDGSGSSSSPDDLT